MFYTICESRGFEGVSVEGRWDAFSRCILHVLLCNLLANPGPPPRHSTGFRGGILRSTNQERPRKSTSSTGHVTSFRPRPVGGAPVACPEAAPGCTAGGDERGGGTSSAGHARRTGARGLARSMTGPSSSSRLVPIASPAVRRGPSAAMEATTM